MNLIKIILAFMLCYSLSLQAQWVQISTTSGSSIGGAMKMERIDGIFYVCSVSSGLFTSPDGVILTNESQGLPKTVSFGFTIYGAIRGVAKLGERVYVAANNASTIPGGVFSKLPNDTMWTKTTDGLTGLALSPTGIIALDDRIILTTGKGIYVLMAGDTTWAASNVGIPTGFVTQAPSFSNGYIYTFVSALPGTAGVYKSRDKGLNWVREIGYWDFLVGASFFVNVNGKIFATTVKGVYTKSDADTGWVQNSTGFSTTALNVTHITIAGSRVYVGTAEGVYYSEDGGTTWIPDNAGFTPFVFGIQGIVADGNDLYAYMTITGIFKQTIATSINEPTLLADGFSLAQNYPNPFNPSTRIQFSIPENGFVTVDIYSLTGEKIISLLSKEMEQGVHSVDWNAEGYSDGMYLYQVTYNGSRLNGKMILLK